MKDILRVPFRWLVALGIDLPGTARTFASRARMIPQVLRDYRKLRRQNRAEPLLDDLSLIVPCLADRDDSAGSTRGAYFHFDLLVARRIHDANPNRHVDVGSRIDGFVAHVASFREIEVFDIRPGPVGVFNIIFRQYDFTRPSPDFTACCDSLSSLHALEHFGLGRYGDPVNLRGHIDGFHAMSTLLKPGGTFYLSVPIGKERIEFNGHRVFRVGTILSLAESSFDLISFSCVDPAGDLHENVPVERYRKADWPFPEYGFGLFELRKKPVGLSS